MQRHELAEALTAKPFEPFRIYVSDGASYFIRHPHLVLITPSAALVGVKEGDQAGPMIERFHSVALSHITQLESVEPAESAA